MRMPYHILRRPTGISDRLKAIVGACTSFTVSAIAVEPHLQGHCELVTYPGLHRRRLVPCVDSKLSPYRFTPSSAAQLFSSTSRCTLSEMQEPVAVKLDDKVYPKDKIFLPDEHASLSQLSAVLHGKIAAFLKSDPRTVLMQQVQRQTETSLGVLKEALDRYGLEKLAISYNGGKDCLVLLILWLVVLHKHYGRSQDASSAISTSASPARLHERFPDSVNTVYIQSPHSFVEVDDFVRESSRQYRLNLCTLNKPMKEAFEDYLQMRPKTEAIFVGTRRTDPHGAALSHFNPTDGDWPKFMRCQPVIDWHYREIWGFIRHFDIPYCRLYDLGFTSLGGIEDTFPNPRLKVDRANNDQGGIEYRPAYELLEDDEERLGRNNKS